MPTVGERWRGPDGVVWRVVLYNSLASTFLMETDGDARCIVTLCWFDAARRVHLRPFLRWWLP